MNIQKKLRLVLKVIELNPGVQNDNADLVAAVWRYEGWDDNKSLEDNIRRVTRSETITRRLRQGHELGLIQYSDESLASREMAFKAEREASAQVWHNFLGMNPEEELAKLTIQRTDNDDNSSINDHTAVSWLND